MYLLLGRKRISQLLPSLAPHKKKSSLNKVVHRFTHSISQAHREPSSRTGRLLRARWKDSPLTVCTLLGNRIPPLKMPSLELGSSSLDLVLLGTGFRASLGSYDGRLNYSRARLWRLFYRLAFYFIRGHGGNTLRSSVVSFDADRNVLWKKDDRREEQN